MTHHAINPPPCSTTAPTVELRPYDEPYRSELVWAEIQSAMVSLTATTEPAPDEEDDRPTDRCPAPSWEV